MERRGEEPLGLSWSARPGSGLAQHSISLNGRPRPAAHFSELFYSSLWSEEAGIFLSSDT